MKIAVVIPIKSEVYKDDTTMFCEGLEKYFGHTIIPLYIIPQDGKLLMYKPCNIDDIEDCDVIWAPYEPLIPLALLFKSKYNKPVMGHFEIVPPRINLDDIEDNYIFDINLDASRFSSYLIYKKYLNCWLSCNFKTYVDDSALFYMKKLYGGELPTNIYVKPYPMDSEMLTSYSKSDVKLKNQICSIARLVPHKKIHHVIKALSLITNPPKYIVIGAGEELDKLKQLAKYLNVDVEFKGLSTDEEKVRTIQESLFLVHPWACLPVAEGAFLKKVSITYDYPILRNRNGDISIYAKANDIQDLADKIKMLTKNEALTKELGEIAHNTIMSGKIPTKPIKEACAIMNEYFKQMVMK
jgi:glycosyltransferase involved in cell wall biosynthesis